MVHKGVCTYIAMLESMCRNFSSVTPNGYQCNALLADREWWIFKFL